MFWVYLKAEQKVRNFSITMPFGVFSFVFFVRHAFEGQRLC